MIAKGQSAEAQARRLAVGRCPVHGASLDQMTDSLDMIDVGLKVSRRGHISRCCRKDCDIWVLWSGTGAYEDGDWQVLSPAQVDKWKEGRVFQNYILGWHVDEP
jgi:hypothetical protein